MTAQTRRVRSARRRWYAMATVVSLAVLAGADASHAHDPDRHGQARPVIDSAFLYNELYYLATNFIFRTAGADGPVAIPTDPNNLPPNYNGAQEFYQWFGAEMTNPTPRTWARQANT